MQSAHEFAINDSHSKILEQLNEAWAYERSHLNLDVIIQKIFTGTQKFLVALDGGIC